MKKEGKNEQYKCLQCDSHSQKEVLYSCCFQSACEKCYTGFHFLQCKKTLPNTHSRLQVPKSSYPTCDRCNSQIKSSIYLCKQCHNAKMCRQCSASIHSKGKFVSHFIKEVKIKNEINILECPEHKKVRKYLTEKGQLICAQCVSENKLKRVKNINEETFQENRQRIEIIGSYFDEKIKNHENTWGDLRYKLQTEYQRLKNCLQEKYQLNLALLEKLQKFDKQILLEAQKKCYKAKRQCQRQQQNPEMKIIQTKLSLFVEELFKQKKFVQSLQCFTYKLNCLEFDKFENLLKNFNIQKIKVKEEDEKQNNKSCRKSNVSSSRVMNNSNLSCSRRSISKSVNKVDELKLSVKNNNSSKNTPPLQNNNSSNKKHSQRNISMVTKLQEIEPVILNFDLKEANQSRINFLSSKTESSDVSRTMDTQNSISNSNISRQSLKRKTDFLDIRERMRKPSMITNRFNKK